MPSRILKHFPHISDTLRQQFHGGATKLTMLTGYGPSKVKS